MLQPDPLATQSRIVVRAGVPHPGSADLLQTAREHGIPILVSANAFSKTSLEQASQGVPWEFRKPNRELLEGLDVALDSAGYVAMQKFNGFPWTIDAYLDLVASFPWSWWAPLDLCVEREIASSRIERRLRIAETAHNWRLCAEQARDRGLIDPIPVLQGQTTSDYLQCADLMPLLQWPSIVGVGSMCRRDLNGADNIEAVVHALDRILPSYVGLHLFGVKSTGAALLADHPRVASIDSCAWSYDLRRRRPTGRNRAMEAEAMLRWWRNQVKRLAAGTTAPASRPSWSADHCSADDPLPRALEEDLQEWLELVASGEADANLAWYELKMRAAHRAC